MQNHRFGTRSVYQKDDPVSASAVVPFSEQTMCFYLSYICRTKSDYNRLKTKNMPFRGREGTCMRLNRVERAYEGVPASSAIAMAVMEESGIRELIDSRSNGMASAGSRPDTPSWP